MATVPKIPNGRPIPLQRRLLYQFLLERFQGDPKGAKFVCLEVSPEGVVAVQVCVRAIACRSSADSDTRTASLTRLSTVASDRGILDSWSTTTSWGSRGSAVG